MDTKQQETLKAIAAGASGVPELAKVTGKSQPTIRNRLEELEALGYVKLEKGVGKPGWRFEITTSGDEVAAALASLGVAATLPPRDAALEVPVATRPFALGAVVMIENVARRDRESGAETLYEAGAEVVLDCDGDVSLVAWFDKEHALAARRITHTLSSSQRFRDTRFAVVAEMHAL